MVQVRNSILEKWDMQEISCKGHTEGNPFTDYDLKLPTPFGVMNPEKSIL